ncbi:exopolysaccharide biosynthesis protein [Rhizobium etli]|uniref:exopolysaccharide biosynthesis protein n=1 Tax=Rhizobium etli TaxID=29449 RepID=UPI0003839027|nr:exopolysaccharide biosynthesis protein [Rhizobium etli]AGS26627.1 exopolysaccharide biosynthesis ExoD family protein [Rhizobium etli bv. mimosae str. Mim1]
MTKRNGESTRGQGIASVRLRELAAEGRAEGGIEIGRAISILGQAGTSLIVLLLTLPTLTPVPGPFGMVFGTALALVAFQIAAGRETVWLPSALKRRRLSTKVLDSALRYTAPLVAWAEKMMRRDRLAVLAGKPVRMLLGVPIFLLAVAIAMPIPFGNFLPAFALIVIAVALMERDGLIALIGGGLSILALAATTAMAYGVVATFA